MLPLEFVGNSVIDAFLVDVLAGRADADLARGAPDAVRTGFIVAFDVGFGAASLKTVQQAGVRNQAFENGKPPATLRKMVAKAVAGGR